MNWNLLLNDDRLKKSTRNQDGDFRNEFESDFGRIIFSPAVRRMHDKTQVFPLTTNDNIHTRLTHSMEVMAIGESLGNRLCVDERFLGKVQIEAPFRKIPVIIKNACLIHDIGNTPFGHFGESIIQNYFENFFSSSIGIGLELNSLEREDFTKFDGNAQGFRVLTKLQMLDDEFGLNLTYGTLGAYLKYPNSGKIESGNIALSKRGVFQSEKNYLKNIVEKCGLQHEVKVIRHPLCYLMEAADSICYLIMDIEDGFNKGFYSYQDLKDYFVNQDGFEEIFLKVDKFKAENSRVVQFRIASIQKFVDLAYSNFVNNLTSIIEGEYPNELIKDDNNKLEKVFSDFCIERIFPHREISSLELSGHSVICGLLDYYIKFVFHKDSKYRKRAQSLISKSILRIAFMENNLPLSSMISDLNDYYKLRVIVDFVSGMTDQFALKHYQELSGQKIG